MNLPEAVVTLKQMKIRDYNGGVKHAPFMVTLDIYF